MYMYVFPNSFIPTNSSGACIHVCVCCTYIRAHGCLVSVLMTYLNAALTLMMLLLIHIDQVHNTLYWWFVINRTCFLHFSFLNLHLCVFSAPFRDAFCETGRADYKPRCSDRRLYHTSLSFSYFLLPLFHFQLSLFHLQLWYKCHYHFHWFSVFRVFFRNRKGRLQTQMLR